MLEMIERDPVAAERVLWGGELNPIKAADV